MPNFGSKILNNAVSSLTAQQAIIGTTANNIANVNTPGYTRRVLNLETRSAGGTSTGLSIGDGVQIGQIQRVADEYINKIARDASAEKNSTGIELDFINRLEGLFSLDDSSLTIGSALTQFFNSAAELATDPSSMELRANFIERVQDVVDSVKNTYNAIANLQDEADRRLATEVEGVNTLTAQIADLNTKIRVAEGDGVVAADERDKRDTLIASLAEKISFKTTEVSDGTVNITLENGFALVNGANSKTLAFTRQPSFAPAPPAVIPESLNEGQLGFIVYDFGTSGTPSHLDLTNIFQAGDGNVGGLLRVRGISDPNGLNDPFEAGGHLVEAASRVEAIARALLSSVNNRYNNYGTTPPTGPSEDLNTDGHPTYTLFNIEEGAVDGNTVGFAEVGDFIGTNAGQFRNAASRLTHAITSPTTVAAAIFTNTGGTNAGDGRNMENLHAFRSQNLNDPANTNEVVENIMVGSYTLTGTFDDAYGDVVGLVGNKVSRASTNAAVAEDYFVTAQSKRDQISGVSLDEEFANLIKFQKAFQASARIIRIADELLEQIVGLI